MVLLYDYFHGFDFAEESLEMKTPMGIVSSKNIDLYLDRLKPEKLVPENMEKIDFTQYSKVFNSELKRYQFDFDSILEQLD